jgi:hypothetical protein
MIPNSKRIVLIVSTIALCVWLLLSNASMRVTGGETPALPGSISNHQPPHNRPVEKGIAPSEKHQGPQPAHKQQQVQELRRLSHVVCDRVEQYSLHNHHADEGGRRLHTRGRFHDDYHSGNDHPADLTGGGAGDVSVALRSLCRVMEESGDSSEVTSWILRTLFPSPMPPPVLPSPSGVVSKGWNWTHPQQLGGMSWAASSQTSQVLRYDENPRSRFCYYVVRNACIERQQLVLYAPSNLADAKQGGRAVSSSPLTVDAQLRGKPFRLCNELRRKFRFHYSIARTPTPRTARNSNNNNNTTTNAHIAACWQYYGFHLFQCLAALFTMQLQHHMHSGVDMYLFNHAVSLHESSRDHFSHQLVLGSASSFLDGLERRRRGRRNAPTGTNRYWGMWAQNTKSPSQIDEVFNGPSATEDDGDGVSPPPRCYDRILVGQVVHHALTVPQRRVHAWWMQSILLAQYRSTALAVDSPGAFLLLHEEEGGHPMRRENASVFRVTIADRQHGKRQGRRSITNIGAVVTSIVGLLVVPDLHATYTGTWSEDGFRHATRVHEHGCVKGVSLTSMRTSRDTIVVCLVDWAALPLSTQAALAHASDIVIAAHGGGNTWIALQRPQTVFIELWHSPYVPRNVFASMAIEYNVRYYSHLRRDVASPGNFMNQDVTVDVSQLLGLLTSAVAYRTLVVFGK